MRLEQPQLQSPQSWVKAILAYYKRISCWAGLITGPYMLGSQQHLRHATSVLARNCQNIPKCGNCESNTRLGNVQRKLQKFTRKRRLAGKLVGSEARIFGVAAMLDIGRISVEGSIKAHSSIYRRHQRSARTKPALYVWYRNMVERILVGDGGLSWQIRTG